jgi:hypothetical protein
MRNLEITTRSLEIIMRSTVFGAVLFLSLSFTPLPVGAQGWPEVFDPFRLLTLNLQVDPADWDTIRRDITNEIEVPAQLWADGEAGILVSVRRKSSRALPSEATPIKVGLKVDVNEYVAGQEWNGLVKLSLENGGDIHPLHEGMAWQLHELASQAGYYGPEPHAALASWVRVNVNGEYIGLYTSVEQRDKRLLENRGVYVKNSTWLYEIDDISAWALEVGNPHSPAFGALCYKPFAAGGKGKNSACATPGDAALLAQLESLIEMRAMLTQSAVDAFTDNPDALFSHGKNFSFADFAHGGLRRRYYPWDLDAVFRSTTSSIYGTEGRRGVKQTEYERLLLNHPTYRAEYNAIVTNLFSGGGPLSESEQHAFLDALEPVLAGAITDDPYLGEDSAATFAKLEGWISTRIANVLAQAAANGPPPPRN